MELQGWRHPLRGQRVRPPNSSLLFCSSSRAWQSENSSRCIQYSHSFVPSKALRLLYVARHTHTHKRTQAPISPRYQKEKELLPYNIDVNMTITPLSPISPFSASVRAALGSFSPPRLLGFSAWLEPASVHRSGPQHASARHTRRETEKRVCE
jgi:hypothetical protein